VSTVVRLINAALTALSLGAAPPTPPVSAPPVSTAPELLAAAPVERACPGPAVPGQVSCLALVRTDVAAHRGVQPPNKEPAGLGALDLQRAYNLPTVSGGKGQTIAIINVYDDPNAESDLAVYRAQYGLPPCTTANGCFKKVGADGGAKLPRADSGWAEEESLDLDMVSAACPNCHILLVEADQPAIKSLGVGVDTAVRLGARYISNSYGGPEESVAKAADFHHFDHPGVAITAASGDGGYGVLFPAAVPEVTAVGGTSLLHAANARGWNEIAWSGAGSGCSRHAAKPAWQKDPGCPRRTVADVSAVADPHTGVAVYDTFGFGGWQVVGGTSASAPIIAGAYALAASLPSSGHATALPYAHPAALNDVVQGSNGTCNPAYLCTAGPGYDGPTGLGTPNGVAAFRAVDKNVLTQHQRSSVPPPPVGGSGQQPGGGPGAMPGGGPGGIVNGGFETGKLTGWTASGVVSTIITTRPHGGKYSAQLGYPDDPAKGDSSIRQSFVAPRGHRKLSFWYDLTCRDKVRYDWATASLRDDTAGTDQIVLEKTCTYEEGWRQVTAPIIGGHAYTLTLTNHDDGYFGDPTATKYDDVATS
jgi:hypothetical protein